MNSSHVTSDGLPREVESFIANFIDSLEQLEVLMILSEGRARAWSGDQIFVKLQSNRTSIQKRLDSLVALGLATKDDATQFYQYLSGKDEIDRVVVAVIGAYQEKRIRVIERIFAKPVDPLATFAEAFKLRKK